MVVGNCRVHTAQVSCSGCTGGSRGRAGHYSETAGRETVSGSLLSNAVSSGWKSYTFLKRNVFNLDLKRLTSEQARISKGGLFHSRGAATENARWPYDERPGMFLHSQ